MSPSWAAIAVPSYRRDRNAANTLSGECCNSDTPPEATIFVTLHGRQFGSPKRVHPDDVERVWAAIEAALDPTDPKPYATEYRVQRGGELRCVEAHGLTYFEGVSHERRAISMVGTAQDITERKEREERSAASRETAKPVADLVALVFVLPVCDASNPSPLMRCRWLQ
jgi:PAS domain S-box-containing protein